MKVNEIIFVVEEDPEGGFTAKSLGYSIFTEGETLEEVKEKYQGCHRLPF